MEMIVVDREGNGLTLSFKGRVILRHSPSRPCMGLGLGSGRIEMRHGMYWLRSERRHDWSEASSLRVAVEAPDRALLEFPGLATLEFTIDEERLRIVPRALKAGCNRVSIRLALVPGEAIHGCGEQFSGADLRGRRFPLWVSESGVGRGPNYVKFIANIHSGRGGTTEHTYFPQPSFVTSGNLYCLAETTAYSVFDFRRKDRCELSFHEVPAALVLGFEKDSIATMGGMTALLGRQPRLPDWVYGGLWLGVQGGSAVVEEKLEGALATGIKVAALWCQDWQGIRMTPYGKQLFWNWDYDRKLYPDLPGLIRRLHARGIRFLGYNNPFLATDAPQWAEASAQGFLVKDKSGSDWVSTTTTFPVSLLDLSNPGTRTWMKGIIKNNMIGIGLDGWMSDFGEFLPPDGQIFSGEDPALVHNRYPLEWARLNREAIEEAAQEAAAETGAAGTSERAVFFSRSGWAGSTKEAPLFWAGDQMVNFMRDAGLPSVLSAGISAGMSGVGNWHFDIGGFLSVAWIRRSRELLLRSAEFAAFTQVMRTHEGIDPPVNAQFDSDPGILAHFARMTGVYAALGDYHRAVAAEYAATGLPPIRSPSLHYPDDFAQRGRPASYLYGRDLLVAPVLRAGARSWRVDLPEDRWVHLWTGQRLGAGRTTVEAPIGEPPVFWREDSLHGELFERVRAAASDGTHR
jgi:alpha-glucosidase